MEKAVVTVAGGRYLLGAAVQALELKETGCTWPHILFTLPGEDLGPFKSFFDYHGTTVREVNGYLGHPWTSKTNAVIQAKADHVLYMDADNLATIPPDDLIADSRYHATGAIFWPDFNTMEPDHLLWEVCGVHGRREREAEAGQLMIDTGRCRNALGEMDTLNRRWKSIYSVTHGDKDVWRMAWHRAGQEWSWGSDDLNIYLDDKGHGRAIVQRLGDRPAFHHRVHAKFSLHDNWWRPGIPNSLRWFSHLEYIKDFLK